MNPLTEENKTEEPKIEEEIKEERLFINETVISSEEKPQASDKVIDKLFFNNSLGENLFPRLKVHSPHNNRTRSQERIIEYL